ncbi:Ppx/GppA phosphatase family protein [Mesorhizobium sp.]|nr:Ppx/GppA phosphatase family protein [Mesorhizobium sp.]
METSSETVVERPLNLDAGLAGAHGEPHYAIVDIGSNSVRMVVYERLGRAPLPRYVEKSLCRLGDGLAETGAISADGFRRTVEALRRFRAIADAMGVTRVDVTATEATRRAENGPLLARAIEDASGLTVRVLQGAEEAHYSALGVISGFFRPVGLVADMGGGSLEVAQALDDRVGKHWTSLPLGALPVEALLKEGLNEAKRHIDQLLKNSLRPSLEMSCLYAVGGGWRTFAKVHMALENVSVPVVHGYTLPSRAIRGFAKYLLRLPPEKLSALPGMAERRARTMPAAALVLERLIKRLQPDRVVFSALGLREGWLYSQLTEAERYLDPLVEGARLIGLPLARVPHFGPALVAWTATLFPGETPAETRLRVASCAVSDIAWRDDPDLRAEESFRRLLRLPFIGLDHTERVFIAAAIHFRYAGKPDAPWLFPAMELLNRAGRKRAQILGRAMLLAYRLSGSAPDVLEKSRLIIEPGSLGLEVSPTARAPDSEVVAARLKLLAVAMGIRRFEVVEQH